MDYLYEDYEGTDFEDMYSDFEDEELYMDEYPYMDDETGPLVNNKKMAAEAKKILEKAKKDKRITHPKVAVNTGKIAGAGAAGIKGAAAASKAIKKAVQDGEFEADLEADFEADLEADFEAMGGDLTIYDQMQDLANRAADADSEFEAEDYLDAMAELSGSLLSSIAGGIDEDNESYEFDYEADLYDEEFDGEADEFIGLLAKAAPVLAKVAKPLVKKGIKAAGRYLRSPATRKFVRKLPRVALSTSRALARDYGAGRRLTPSRIAATLGRETYRAYRIPYNNRRRRSRRSTRTRSSSYRRRSAPRYSRRFY